MMSWALLFLVPMLSLGSNTDRALSGGYNYNRCDSTYGPDDWPGACQNQVSGTPINLCGAVAFSGGAPAISVTGYSTARTMNIYSDGASLIVNVVTNAPTLTAGILAQIVGQTTNTTTQTWTLQQMHLHWGRLGKSSEGSEHYLQGTQYAAEAHFVHYNSRFANFSAAVSSGATDALLVVGILLQAGTTDQSATITAMANAATTVTTTPTAMSTVVTLSDLFDGTGTYYSYGGSLTTPTCLQIVTWIVMTTPKTISTNTLSNLWKVSTSPGSSSADAISKYGNYRPLQTVGSRTLYNSNGATAACTTPTEPSFSCTNSSSTSGSVGMLTPPLILQAAILMLLTSLASWQ